MGVDYGGSGNLYALGSGQVTSVFNSGWPGGTFIGIHLTSTDQYVYYAEDITSLVRVGQTVKAGQLIGRATGGSSGIEIGWAAPPGTGNTMAAQTGQNKAGLAKGDPGLYPTAYGVSMSNLIQSLGGPPGIVKGPIQGSVPSSFGSGNTASISDLVSGCAPQTTGITAVLIGMTYLAIRSYARRRRL
jgi:hypothetical protein